MQAAEAVTSGLPVFSLAAFPAAAVVMSTTGVSLAANRTLAVSSTVSKQEREFLLGNHQSTLGISIFCYESAESFAVVNNNPLSYTDPSGMGGIETGLINGSCAAAWILCGAAAAFDVAELLDDIFGGGPPASIPGSLATPSSPIMDSADDDISSSGSLDNGTLFGSGNTSPFVFSWDPQATVGAPQLPLANGPLDVLVGWWKHVGFDAIDLMSGGDPTPVAHNMMWWLRPSTIAQQNGWNASGIYYTAAMFGGIGKTGRKINEARYLANSQAVDLLRRVLKRLKQTPNKTQDTFDAIDIVEGRLNQALKQLKKSEPHGIRGQGPR